MIRLIEINEDNFLSFAALRVREEQRAFLDSAAGILARGYAYRACRARVFGVTADGTAVGLALVKDLDEEPACYDLQQFMIDGWQQGKGYGTVALRLILAELERERKYPCVEVCVKRADAAALRVYEKCGFADTGYVDEEAPDCLNLMYEFPKPAFHDALLTDFTDPLFQAAFRQYFAELGISVKDWDGLFRQMNEEGGNEAIVRTGENGELVGFIQFRPIPFTSWFFEETCGFIREFWVAAAYRNGGHGAALLRQAEERFRAQGIRTAVLTSDTAERFYLRHGYEKAPACRAKNGDEVFVKRLG